MRVVLSTIDMISSRRSFSVGDVAQLVERQVDTPCVVGSNSAISNPALRSIRPACIVKSIRQSRVRAGYQLLAQWEFANRLSKAKPTIVGFAFTEDCPRLERDSLLRPFSPVRGAPLASAAGIKLFQTPS